MSNKYSAGLTLFALGIFPLAIWYIYLFSNNLPNQTWTDNLNYTLSDESQLKRIFILSVIFGILSLLASFVYFSIHSNSKTVLLLLLIFSGVQAGLAAQFTQLEITAFYVLSVVICYLAYTNPNKSSNLTGADDAPSS